MKVSKEPQSAFAIYSEKLKQKKSKKVLASNNDKIIKKPKKPDLKTLKMTEIGNILMKLAQNSANVDFSSLSQNVKDAKGKKARKSITPKKSCSEDNGNNVNGVNNLVHLQEIKRGKPEKVFGKMICEQQKIGKVTVTDEDSVNQISSMNSLTKVLMNENNKSCSISNGNLRFKKRKRARQGPQGPLVLSKHENHNVDEIGKHGAKTLMKPISPLVTDIQEICTITSSKKNKTLSNRTVIHDKKNKTGLQRKTIQQTRNKSEMEKSNVLEGNRLFNWLILPVPENDFMVDYWEKQPLLIQREGNRNYFSKLLSTPAIDAVLREHVVCFTKHLDVTSYTDGVRETHNLTGRAQANVVWDFYSNGCSIRLLNPQAFIPEIHAVNATLQEYFGCFVGANVYLTPPNSQGFAPHYDDIEAFILQVEGRKHWKVYPPRNNEETLPRLSSPNFSQEEIGQPFLDVTLEPGDLLYFPRGWIHQASTVDGQHSLHITLSAYQKTAWIDLLEKALPLALKKAAAEDVEFRKGLPRGYLDLEYHSSDAAKQSFTSTADSLIAKLGPYLQLCLGAAVDQMGAQFMHDALPPVITPDEKLNSALSGGLKMVENGELVNRVEFDLNTQIKLIRPNVCRLVEEEEEVRLYHCLDNPLEYHAEDPQFLVLPPEGVDVVTFLSQKYPAYTEIRRVPHTDEDALLTLVSDLWDAGLLVSRGLQTV